MSSRFRAGLVCIACVLCDPLAFASDDGQATMAASSVGQVLVLPRDSLIGTVDVGSLRADVAHEDGFRVYRVEFRGRTYWAHRVLGGRSRPVAFVPNEGRFVDVLPEMKVVLNDPDSLEAVIDAAGALDGKAYPPGWALLRLRPEANPAAVAEALQSHPSVTSAEVRLRRSRVRPMQAQDDDSAHKDSPAADLSAEVLGVNYESLATEALDVTVLYENRGAAASSETTVAWALATSPDFSEDAELSGEFVLPPIPPGGELEWPITLYLSELSDTSENISYYGEVEIADSPEEPARNRANNTAAFGFTMGPPSGGSSTVRARCDQVNRRGALGHGNPDPFVDQQWHLVNTGQAAFASNRGVPGEDLNMGGVIADPTAPTGAGVRVAIVDTGLEICHPDLEANVEPGKSWNFLAPDSPAGSRQHDPFFPRTGGDHGTSVAGITAAASDNGIGGRGVAPDVLLRGYNFLPAARAGLGRSRFDSLGMSRADPDSSAVDVFNMSFGTYGLENAPLEWVELFRHGVENLREGLGAIYVKAAGNDFWGCWHYYLPANNDIGCVSASADASHNLPYLIVVGALNAHGVRASYSSPGANLWISAPAGESGPVFPAMITTDQMGRDTGYSGRRAGLGGDASLNPNGNYVSTFDGTSSAAPNVSGAVALLLEARPDLTWRDIKHILARTARQVDPGRAPVERLLSGGYYELQHRWTVNGAGHRFHNWYGFGAVDVDAALNLAAVHQSDTLGEYWETLPYTRDALALSIADSNLNGARDQLRIDDLDPAARVESATVTVRVDHPFPHDLSIELISPSGTRSVLNPAFNNLLGRPRPRLALLEWNLLSNAFYGEDPAGDWELVVVDAATRDEGRLTGWDLRLGLGSHAPGIHPAGGTSDDHGNIRRAATGVGFPGSIGGALELAGDVDYFRIVVANPTTVVLTASGSTDTTGVLEGEDGVVLAADGDGGDGAGFRIVYQLTPGIYYLRVEGKNGVVTGDYAVHLQSMHSVVVPLMLAADRLGQQDRQGFVRVVNLSNRAGPVRIVATDDDGVRANEVTMTLGPNQTQAFNSTDLESGNSGKGLSGGTGEGAGDWRLEVASELNIEVGTYVRTRDGFLTSMHDVVGAGSDGRYYVPIFNPASNVDRRSILRLVNPDRVSPVDVAITGYDEAGVQGDSVVALRIAPGAVAVVDATELENGGAGVIGSLGDGQGKWRLFVEAGHRIIVVSLLDSVTGDLTNLSLAGPQNL